MAIHRTNPKDALVASFGVIIIVGIILCIVLPLSLIHNNIDTTRSPTTTKSPTTTSFPSKAPTSVILEPLNVNTQRITITCEGCAFQELAFSGDCSSFVGGQQSNIANHSVLVMSRSPEGYDVSQELYNPSATESIGINGFGRSVDMSDDAETLLIGTSFDDYYAECNECSLYVYNKDTESGLWPTAPSVRITVVDHGSNMQSFGVSSRISADGSTIAATANMDGAACAHIFIKESALVWTEQQTICGSDQVGVSFIQMEVALSFNGSIVVFSNIGDDSFMGAVWIFHRNDTDQLWYQQGDKIIVEQIGDYAPQFGFALDISDDGNVLVVTAINNNNYLGNIWIYVRVGDTWEVQSGPIIPDDAAASAHVAKTVSITPDGNLFIVGSPTGNSDAGSTWVYVRGEDGIWTQAGLARNPPESDFNSNAGFSAVCPLGDVMVIGGNGPYQFWIYETIETATPTTSPVTP